MATAATDLSVVAVGCAGRHSVRGDAQRSSPHGVISVARHARARQADVIAAFVAIGARQHPMHARKRAAHAVVVEARPRKGLLRVAIPATRPKGIVVYVVSLVATDAKLREPLQHAAFGVALFAHQTVVRAAKTIREQVVPGVDELPARRFVASLTTQAQLVFVGFGVGVAVLAHGGRRFVFQGRMASLAANGVVFAFQAVAVFGFGVVVIKGHLAGRAVTLLAPQTEAAPVCVVLQMAACVSAVLRSGFVPPVRVTAFAPRVFVFADQGIVALVVVKARRGPAGTLVAFLAVVFAERAFVEPVFVASGALRRSVPKLVVFVTCAAVFDSHAVDGVPVHEREGRAGAMSDFDALLDVFGVQALFHFAGL